MTLLVLYVGVVFAALLVLNSVVSVVTCRQPVVNGTNKLWLKTSL
jgi:hypothetical protein